jgi:hypothetical protein
VSETARQWAQGCAIGCAALVAVSVVGVVGLTLSMRAAFNDATADRTVLTERYGEVGSYTPAADGSVAADRMAAFLTVREALREVHAEVMRVDGQMGDFERLAEDGEPPMRVALPAVVRMSKAMMGLPRVFGEIESARNRALVEVGMGLGEYTYIYAMAYHDELMDPAAGVHLFGSSAASSRVRDELRGMIRRQLDAARTALGDEDPRVAALAAELDALDGDAGRIPWADGLPPEIAAGFAPFRERLEAGYSAAAAELDLLNSSVKHGGLTITMD